MHRNNLNDKTAIFTQDSGYQSYIEQGSPEAAANALLCVIHQASYLLDQQLRRLEERFLAEGGFTERLYHARQAARHRRPFDGAENL